MEDLIEKTLKTKKRISDKFHENSLIDSYKGNDFIGEYPKDWVKINYKSYPRLNQFYLPKIRIPKQSLVEVLLSRRSRRNYTKRFIDMKELATLLILSSGISSKGKDWDSISRTYPSAGARYPVEVYVIANRVKNLNKGLYHFNIKSNSLEQLKLDSLKDFLIKNTGQPFVGDSSCVIILSAVLERTRIKYEERGYRFILMECGHIAQNIYLISEAMNLKCCAIGGFIDEEFNKLLDLQGQSEKTMYLLSIGK